MPAVAAEQGDSALIDPRIERRQISEAQIDSENIEVGVYGGLLAVDNFNAPPVLGVRAAWHVSEDIFFELAMAEAKTGETSFEKLGGGVQLLTDDERVLRYYNFSVGYTVLPGEAFAGRNRAFTNGLYLVGGAGSTEFAGDSHFTLNVGAGYRLLLTDWLNLRMEMRNHLFEVDVFGGDEVTNNLEWTFGLGGFF
ncbi:MAG: outer membrane beta-barrel domain-containing protein [Alcanivoracaceae bacterium]|nr:outer membrane beta-barrel domain-containing protein [Alcanivoracaceae bacterium]